MLGVGLFKLLTAVWKGRGQHPEVLAGTGMRSRRASSRDLDSLAALTNANISLNGEAMCWQEHTLTLFQLHGIKHCRYARRRIFIEGGKRSERVAYRAPTLICL